MTGLIRKLIGLASSLGSIRHSSTWNQQKRGSTWEIIDENDRAVKVRHAPSEKYKNMETGEVAIFVDTWSAKIEWYEFKNKIDWPIYIKKSYQENRRVWNDEVDELPMFGGAWISKGGGSPWKRIE